MGEPGYVVESVGRQRKGRKWEGGGASLGLLEEWQIEAERRNHVMFYEPKRGHYLGKEGR